MLKRKGERYKRIPKKETDIAMIALKCHLIPLIPKNTEYAKADGQRSF